MLNRKLVSFVATVGLAFLGTQASAATKFGSALDHQPTPPERCRANASSDLCSFVLVLGRNPGHEKAPKAGKVKFISLLSCTRGSFILQIARALPSQHRARGLRPVAVINYHGDPRNCDGRDKGFIIENYPVNFTVQTADYLSVIATKVGFIYSSGDREDVFDPPLADGGDLRTTSNTGLGSGILLLQATYDD